MLPSSFTVLTNGGKVPTSLTLVSYLPKRGNLGHRLDLSWINSFDINGNTKN